jgi:hypothetical protein
MRRLVEGSLEKSGLNPKEGRALCFDFNEHEEEAGDRVILTGVGDGDRRRKLEVKVEEAWEED